MEEKQKNEKFDMLLSNSKQKIAVEVSTFILEVVQLFYGLPEQYAQSRSRKRTYVIARQMAMYLIRRHTTLSLSYIGDMFNRDHATALHSINQIKNYLCWDKEIKSNVKELERIIKFKATALNSDVDWRNDYYFLDMNDFYSITFDGQPDKAITMSGYTQKEVESIAQILAGVKGVRLHNDTGMYVLEQLNNDKKQNNEGEES